MEGRSYPPPPLQKIEAPSEIPNLQKKDGFSIFLQATRSQTHCYSYGDLCHDILRRNITLC